MPRIEAELHAWPRPYRGFPGLDIHVFSTGSLSLPRGLLFAGGDWAKQQTVDVPAYVVRHPSGRLIVFDAGYSAAVHDDPNRYLGFLASIVGSFAMAKGQDLPAQMELAGLDPAAVSHVVLSHLHFDHAGSAERFINAEVVVSRAERARARHASGVWTPFQSADYDDIQRWTEIEFDSSLPHATFSSHKDLLGDGSLMIVPLAGHTVGSIGVLVRMEDAPVLLAGDAAAVEESWRFAAMPFWAEDKGKWWDTIWRIKKFLQLVPDAIVMGGHDAQEARTRASKTIVNHPFEASTTQ